MIELSLVQVSLALVPVILALFIYGYMVDDWRSVLWATFRMVLQLLLIGYALTAIFNIQHPIWILIVVLAMSIGAGWIAARPIRQHGQTLLPVFLSVFIAGSLHLVWIMATVIRPDPWFLPSVVIPIAGMVMSNTMNAVSLCAERFWSERAHHLSVKEASQLAMSASMIPQINALLAVGLVSLPGMMTGSILSGVSPLLAVRYQIVIMAMVLSTSAMGSFLYLRLQKTDN